MTSKSLGTGKESTSKLHHNKNLESQESFLWQEASRVNYFGKWGGRQNGVLGKGNSVPGVVGKRRVNPGIEVAPGPKHGMRV